MGEKRSATQFDFSCSASSTLLRSIVSVSPSMSTCVVSTMDPMNDTRVSCALSNKLCKQTARTRPRPITSVLATRVHRNAGAKALSNASSPREVT
jgi:hypothetical protein